MSKVILNYIKSRDGIFIIIGAVILLTIGFSIVYTWPREINLRHNGIKYQAGTVEGAEPILIEINGEYSRGLFRRGDKFYGTVKLDGKLITDWPISFDKNNRGFIDSEEGTYGSIFIVDKFENLTIAINKRGENGGEVFNSGNGWLVSAPCKDREEAVQISNMLIQKHMSNVVIR